MAETTLPFRFVAEDRVIESQKACQEKKLPSSDALPGYRSPLLPAERGDETYHGPVVHNYESTRCV
jgi:hypothetical protein